MAEQHYKSSPLWTRFQCHKKYRLYLISFQVFPSVSPAQQKAFTFQKVEFFSLSDMVFLSLDMKLEVNSEVRPLHHPSLAERCLQGVPPQRMIDCLSLTPHQGWEEHFGARVRLICHFQIPSHSLSYASFPAVTISQTWRLGNCKITKTEVNELMGSHCGRLNTVCVFTLFRATWALKLDTDTEILSSWIFPLEKTTFRWGIFGNRASRVAQVVGCLGVTSESKLWVHFDWSILFCSRKMWSFSLRPLSNVFCQNCILFCFIRTGSARKRPERPHNTFWRLLLA